MPETSYLWDNPGTGDSPGAGYGNDLLAQVIHRMLFNGTLDQGVLLGWGSDLECTVGGVDTVTVLPGAAFTYGVWYENTANQNVDVNAFRGGNCQIIVRASWGAVQTSRLTAIAVAAMVKNPGVTYDIPLWEVSVNAAGVVALVTDDRDYCEFSTEPWPFGVDTTAIQASAVTPAKLLDKDRWLDRGHGCITADVANPATWTSHMTVHPYSDAWTFAAAALNAGWITFRVPADYAGGGVDVVFKDSGDIPAGAWDVRWLYSAEVAASGAPFANQAGIALQTFTYNVDAWNFALSAFTLVNLAVAAGDLVLLRISRDGAHGTDTFADVVALFEVDLNYTADS